MARVSQTYLAVVLKVGTCHDPMPAYSSNFRVEKPLTPVFSSVNLTYTYDKHVVVQDHGHYWRGDKAWQIQVSRLLLLNHAIVWSYVSKRDREEEDLGKRGSSTVFSGVVQLTIEVLIGCQAIMTRLPSRGFPGLEPLGVNMQGKSKVLYLSKCFQLIEALGILLNELPMLASKSGCC